jgi:anti-sigma B factor antagonist
MEVLQIHLDHAHDPPVLEVSGEIDMATADELRQQLGRALADDPRLVVDLGGVTFMGAAGIRVFLRAASGLNGSGPLRFVNAERLAWLLDVVGLKPVESISICDAE